MKTALCIKKEELFSKYNITDINNLLCLDDNFLLTDLTYSLEDRTTCETDHTKLQLIPYLTIKNISNDTYFIFKRGMKGNEKRLHNLYSLGLGGHIEQEVNYDNYIYKVIINCISRELFEEIGLQLTDRQLQHIETDLILRNYELIYTEETDINEAHLGLWMIIEIDDCNLQDHEEGVITDGQWLTKEQLHNFISKDTNKLESWSFCILPLL